MKLPAVASRLALPATIALALAGCANETTKPSSILSSFTRSSAPAMTEVSHSAIRVNGKDVRVSVFMTPKDMETVDSAYETISMESNGKVRLKARFFDGAEKDGVASSPGDFRTLTALTAGEDINYSIIKHRPIGPVEITVGKISYDPKTPGSKLDFVCEAEPHADDSEPVRTYCRKPTASLTASAAFEMNNQ